MEKKLIELTTSTGDPPADCADTGPILLAYEQLAEIGICYSKEHIRNMEKDGQFPVRVRLSPKRVAWDRNEITDWLRQRLDARTTVIG
ncbi:helix-turn-helix transcriptional regulator [Yoonia sp. 208BN28-4]|uniref:helix-turn-helix transcriptional regulator n=1 Tax=Yoonia sp. 208BN28-4 TaxID=3126505 RepID=UPI0030A63A7D